MSTDFHWILPEVEPRPSRIITTPAGDSIEVDIPAVPTFRGSNDPRVHIGKSSNAKFYWAQDPAKVRKVCEKFRADEVIEDEYGSRYTGAAFLDYIKGGVDILDSIGERF